MYPNSLQGHAKMRSQQTVGRGVNNQSHLVLSGLSSYQFIPIHTLTASRHSSSTAIASLVQSGLEMYSWYHQYSDDTVLMPQDDVNQLFHIDVKKEGGGRPEPYPYCNS